VAAAMTAISVTSVNVLDNPSKATNPLQFEIQYECMFDLADDLEWKLTYVGSAESEKYDQVLDTVFVGPVAPGQYRFVFQADPPNFQLIPPDDIVGVTVILLTCSYKSQVRCPTYQGLCGCSSAAGAGGGQVAGRTHGRCGGSQRPQRAAAGELKWSPATAAVAAAPCVPPSSLAPVAAALLCRSSCGWATT
jgi:hypothetical protein